VSASVVDSVMKKHMIKNMHDKLSTSSGRTSSCVSRVKDCDQGGVGDVGDVDHMSAFYDSARLVYNGKLHTREARNTFGLDKARMISMNILKASKG